MAARVDPRSPVAVRARYLAVRGALATLALGAALATAGFAVLARRAAAWLAPSAAEGLVFGGAVLGLALVMLGLNFWYLGRPTRGVAPPERARPTGPGRAGLGLLGAAALMTAALVWYQHRYAAEIALSRARSSTLDRALFGEVQAPFAGLMAVVTVIVATFVVAAFIRARSA